MKPIANLYINEKEIKQNGKVTVKVKITFMRKRKYYSTGVELTPHEYKKAMFAERKTETEKETNKKLLAFQTKADDVIDDLTLFTFSAFEEKYFEHRNTYNSVEFAFDKYINDLIKGKRLGTASSYKDAKVSICKFKKDLIFADITPKFLKEYQKYMIENGKSISTVGIYLRPLRTILNAEGIDKSIYPFGKDKYTIPESNNKKKSLSSIDIGKIYNYHAVPKSMKDMAKDYWIFLYLCNGMNVKDFCQLKWSNINNDVLTFQRAKTKETSKESKLITVSLKNEATEIIKKWSITSMSKDSFVFPHLTNKMSDEDQRRVIKQLTKNINKYMKVICTELGINIATTYWARHSFATVLKQSGAHTSMISDLLGHSNIKTTESYLGSFETEQIKETTDILTQAFK